MEVKPGYKQTEVGMIPGEWEVCRLDSLGPGSMPPIKAGPFGSSLTKDTYVPTGYKVYGQEQVIRGDYLYGDYYISPSKYRELQSCAVSPGDVLLSLVGTAGKLLVVPDDAPAGIINPRLIRFSFDKKRVCPWFFKHLFETGQVQSFLSRYAQGGTMGVLNAGILRPVIIPLPPLPEQRAIAAALGDVDALIGSLERLIAKKRDLKQAAMQQLLTGQTRLPGFCGSWEITELGRICQTSSGTTPSRSLHDRYYRAGDVHWVKTLDLNDSEILTTDENVTQAALRETSLRVYLQGTVLLAMYGGFLQIGRTGILRIPAAVNQAITAIQLDRTVLLPEYLIAVLNHRVGYWKAVASSSRKDPNITSRDIKAFPIAYPGLKEQAAIAEVLTDIDSEIAALENRRDKTRLLKQGMMQELLTGRVRLV